MTWIKYTNQKTHSGPSITITKGGYINLSPAAMELASSSSVDLYYSDEIFSVAIAPSEDGEFRIKEGGRIYAAKFLRQFNLYGVSATTYQVTSNKDGWLVSGAVKKAPT